MTDDEVLAVIREHAGDEVADRIPMRLQPQGDHPGEKEFRMPVPLEDGRYLAVRFTFGTESDDAMESWKPTWIAVDGPSTREELEASK